jgi:hypothetical protein
MTLTRSLAVSLTVLVAVVAALSVQALANHTANVSVVINYVRVLADTDPGPFQGCSDVYVKAKVTSSTGQVREKKTGTRTTCPVRTIFAGTTLNLTNRSTNKITAGPFTFQYGVKDDDDGPFNSDDTMNSGTQLNVACNGLDQTFTDLAGAGDSADIQIRVRCLPIAHAAGAAELGRFQTAQIEIFDAAGRKVLDLRGGGAERESLMAGARARLANGVYLTVTTIMVNGQAQRRLGKLIVLGSGLAHLTPARGTDASNSTSIAEGAFCKPGCIQPPLRLRFPDLVVTRVRIAGPAAVKADGTVELPIRVTVRNRGNAAARIFKISVEYTELAGGTYGVAFTVPGQASAWYPFTNAPLAAGRSVTFSGKLTFLARGQIVSLRAKADSCSGDEFMPDYCRVLESNEGNNQSAAIAVALP